jgi:hypothetical protein
MKHENQSSQTDGVRPFWIRILVARGDYNKASVRVVLTDKSSGPAHYLDNFFSLLLRFQMTAWPLFGPLFFISVAMLCVEVE